MESKLSKGNNYLLKKREYELYTEELTRIRERIEEITKKANKIQRLLIGLKEELSELNNQLDLAKEPLYDLRGDTYYKEVVN